MSASDHSLQMLFSILESTDRTVSPAKTTRALLLGSSTSQSPCSDLAYMYQPPFLVTQARFNSVGSYFTWYLYIMCCLSARHIH